MSVVPGEVDTDQQPPMAVPLRHFLVGLGFLLVGLVLGVGLVVGLPLAWASLAHVHLLLVGWVCITIMGAMTQFVPVWSGESLHSRRLPEWQLRLVVVGLVGFVSALLTERLMLTPVFGVLMLVGFWTFVYNIGRTLPSIGVLDVTERHFAVALGFFLLVTLLGPLLALDVAVSVLTAFTISHPEVLAAHATLAVFGAVLTTVVGALYQLGTMFTGTELQGVDLPLRRLEEAVYPTGVVLLAGGRLGDVAPVAAAGGLLVLTGLSAFAIILARKLYAMQVAWTPMHRRYAVVPLGIALWVTLTAPAWVRAPLAPSALLGAGGAAHLLLVGVVGFVVFGTLYHVVPFVVWVHAYSDRLGFESVPMVDDLYDGRLAVLDFVLLLAGTVAIALFEAGPVPGVVAAAGGILVLVGATVFVTNLGLVVTRHSPQSLSELLVGVSRGSRDGGRDSDPAGDDSHP